MKGEKQKKLSFMQMLWVGVAGVGSLLLLVSIVSSLVKVNAPHPTDPVQKYDCGSVMAPVNSLSDSKYSTDIVCKDAMNGRRGGAFWMELWGWILMTGGVVMLVRSLVWKKKAVADSKKDDE